MYENGRQYDSLDALKEAIIYAWDQIPQEALKNMIRSFPKHLVKVIEAKGHISFLHSHSNSQQVMRVVVPHITFVVLPQIVLVAVPLSTQVAGPHLNFMGYLVS